MKFSIATSNGRITNYEGTFSVADSGVLSIKPDKGNPVILSQSGWLSIEVTDAAGAYEKRGLTTF